MSGYLRTMCHQYVASNNYHRVSQNVTVNALVKLDNQADALEIAKKYDCLVLEQIGNIYIMKIPMPILEQMLLDDQVLRIEAHEMPQPTMFEAPSHINADKAWNGTYLPQAYTGKGVIAGVVDTGFLFTHSMFLDGNGNTRISKYFDMTDLAITGDGGITYDSCQITEIEHSALAESSSHGTEVASVMVGSMVEGGNGIYCGIAPESSIVLAEINSQGEIDEHGRIIEGSIWSRPEGTSADCILAFKRIFDYADSIGRPCVINISMGFPMSIIDPCILENEAISQLVGPGHIIVAGAGNNGSNNNLKGLYSTLSKKGNDHIVTASFYGENGTESFFSEAQFIDCYLLTDDSQEVSFILGDDNAPKVITINTDTLDTLNGDTCSFSVISAMEETDTMFVQAVKVTNPPSYIKGGLYMYITSIKSGNYPHLSSWLNAHQRSLVVEGNYFTIGEGIRVTISSNNPCEMYTNTGVTPFIHARLPFEDKPSYCINKKHSIAWPAESPSIIGVGATKTRSILGQPTTNETLAEFSSQGPTWSNQLKPEVSAPGSNIIAAYNAYAGFTVAYDFVGEDFDFMAKTNGTSISSPMVAGTIALWLQAKPDLSPSDIRDVLAHSCKQIDDADIDDYPNNMCGYGKIDAYAGLLYILGIDNTKIEGLSMKQPEDIRIKMDGGILTVVDSSSGHPYEGNVKLSVYTADGKMVASSNYNSLTISQLPKGVYVVQISSNRQRATGSTLIRL